MPLQLADPLKVRLQEQLVAELAKATVFANYSISNWTLRGLSAIRSLPDKGDLADQLRAFIGDDPFSTFVLGELDQVKLGEVDLEAGDQPLSQYQAFENLPEVSRDLVDRFSTLPWQYYLTIRLPDSIGPQLLNALGEYALSPRHRIVSGRSMNENFQPDRGHGLASLLVGNAGEGWRDESAYFQVAAEGYFKDQQTEPFLSARDDVLTFFGLGIALQLFDESSFNRLGADQGVKHYSVHQSIDGEWVAKYSIDIDDQHQNAFTRVQLASGIRENRDAIAERLNRIGTVFRADDGRGVGLSARWMFNSICGKDALLQYVQASVAIEILLGDEEVDPNVGLTTLMANRFAYSIAQTPEARTNLLRTFRDIYKIRSKIVHRGKNRLNKDEMRLFHALQVLLRLLIDSEQRLLERSEDNRARKAREAAAAAG